VGRVASALPSFEFSPGQTIRGVAALPKIIRGTAEAAEKKAATSLAAQIGAQTGITAAQTGVLEHRLPTPTELLEAAATAATFGHPRFSFPIPQSLQRPYARQNQEAAALHGNVRSQQESTGQLPAQEGGAGVQPRPEKLAKATQIPLSGAEPPPVAGQGIPRITGTDELGYTLHFQGKSEAGFPSRAEAEKAAQEIWDGVRPMAGDVSDDLAEKMEREAISEGERQGAPVKSVEKFGDEDANVPFSPFFMKATGTGVELKRSTFREWIQDLVNDGLNEDQIRLAVHSRIGEEKFHNDVMAVASDKEIAQYSQDLTAAEKAIERRIYGVRNLTDLQLGHEAIRRRLQQAHGMTPSEFAETVGKEHVTIRTLDALGRIIRRSREALGTKAAGRQGVLYKRALTNIEYAKAAVSGRQQPGAARRERETTPPELADLEGARKVPLNLGSSEYFKLIDQMEKRGVSVDGSPLKREDMPAFYEAAEEILLNGYDYALEMARVQADNYPTEPTPQGNSTRDLVHAIELLKGKDVRLGPLIPFPGWKSETQLRLDLPSAARRRKDEPGQGEMFGKQPLSAPRLIKASDPEARKIPEGTTLPQYNANQIAEMAQRVLQSEKPSFRSFYGWARRNLGDVPTGPMFSVWIDAVNNNLQGKPGAELNKMVEQLGLQHRVYPFQKRVGTKPLEGTSTEFTPEQLKAAGPLPGVVYNRVDIPDSQAVPHDPRDLPPQMVTDIRKGVEEKWKKENLLQDERLIEAEKNKAVEQARKDFMKAFPPELRDAIIDRREAIKRGQKLRMKAISAIFQKLIEEGYPDTSDLLRKEIAIDDLDWSNPNAKEGVWRDIRGDEAKNVDKLNEIFRDEARRSSFDNVSHTKRVAVMLNKNDSTVAIVSAYPHGRSGTMVFEPSGATGIKGKPSVPIGSVLHRWRPIASMLLKEPVKDFYKKFENIEKFNDYIGKAAQETERSFSYDPIGEEPGEHWRNVPEWLRSDYESGQIAHSATDVQLDELKAMAAEAGVREQDVVSQGGETTERFGTMVTEPGKGIEYERRGGQLTKDNPLSTREALELQDFILDEAPAIRSKEDLSKVIEELASRAQTGRLKPREWLAISALRKAASETYVRENAKVRALRSELRGRNLPADIPYISRETAYKIALDRFYDLTQSTETRADFLAGAMEQFSRPAAEARVQAPGIPVTSPSAKGVSRELTMRSRRPPTSTNWQGPPLPTGEARTEPADPELLSPEGQELARKRAEAQFPYEPTEGEPPEFKLPTGKGEVVQYRSRPGFLMKRTGAEGGYTLGPLERRRLPGAAIRGAENVRQRWEEMREYSTKYTAQLTRSNTMRDINSTADGADRQVETYSNRASNDIRLASVKPSEQPRKATLKERLLGGVIHSPEAVKVRKAAKAVMAALQIATDEEWIRVYNERQALKAEFEPLFEEAERQHKKRPVIPEERKPKFKQPEWVEAKHFEKLIAQADKAIRESDDWMKAVNPIRRIQGRKWNRAARALKEEALYAQEHYNDPEMLATVSTYQSIMDAHLNNMNRSGFKIQGRDFYVPGRYDGEIWNDYRLTWGDMRILGRNYRMPKSFRNYYEAISNGPYIPANGDIADLAQHSLAAGGRVMMRDIWLRGLKEFTDPVSKQPVAIEPQWTRVSDSKVDPEKIQSLNPELQPVFEELNNLIATHDPDSRTGKEARRRLESFQKALAAGSHFEWQVPKGKLEYSLVHPSHSSKPIAVREGYKAAVESAMARSVIHDIPVLGDALRVSQMLKHGLILIMDTFHPGRLAQYGAALAGKNIWDIQKPGFHSGLHALMYNPESLEHAVKIGAVSKKAADWALEPVKLYDRGRIMRMSRQKLLDYLVKNGLNATQTADTIYRNSIQRIPFIGERWNQMLSPANKWIFDRITPGLIAESAVKNLERINPKNRHLSLQQQAREVVRDMNVFYGNVGRNGIFKNPNTRDLAQIFLLAPLWQEGLIGKELRTLSRLTGVSYALGRRGLGADVYLGPLTRGVVRGLGAYFVLTQMANLISRGKWTWENEEPDHKMDAWLPIGPEGIWVSPMSVFGEVAHDLVRLAESKSKNWDAITQFGMNKLGPIGRLGVILGSGKTPAGEDISTTGGVLSRAASELAPAPISIGTFAKAAAPGLLGAPRPGRVGQRLLSSVGIKAQLPTRSESDIRKLSERFLEREGLKYEPLKFSPTDEASYAKLRAAVRNDDESGAAQLLTELRKHRTDAQILKAMREASQRPYTGSQANERMFLYSLSDRDLDLYYKANIERAELYQKFIEWFTRQPL